MTDKSVHIKWIGPHSPIIKLPNGTIIRLSKAELMELSDELNNFISYYSHCFNGDIIELTDDPIGDC